MINDTLAERVSMLPAGLTLGAAAQRLGISRYQARKTLQAAGYRPVDGRSLIKCVAKKFLVEQADWSKSNVALARAAGVSRERVRQVRERLGIQMVESRGRPKGMKMAKTIS